MSSDSRVFCTFGKRVTCLQPLRDARYPTPIVFFLANVPVPTLSRLPPPRRAPCNPPLPPTAPPRRGMVSSELRRDPTVPAALLPSPALPPWPGELAPATSPAHPVVPRRPSTCHHRHVTPPPPLLPLRRATGAGEPPLSPLQWGRGRIGWPAPRDLSCNRLCEL